MNKYLQVLCFAVLMSAVFTGAEEAEEKKDDQQQLVQESQKEEELKESESHHHHHGGGGGHGHGEYYQYAKVPGPHEYEFGYKKGNPHHFRERHEQKDGPRFRTKVRWGDKHGGYGEHFWEYNHAPKHHDKHHGH